MTFTIIIPAPKHRLARNSVVQKIVGKQFDIVREGEGADRCIVVDAELDGSHIVLTVETLDSVGDLTHA